MAAQAQRQGLGGADLADRVRRRRRLAGRAGDPLRGVRALAGTADGQRARADDGRPDRHRARHRRPEGALPLADPERRRDVVPGLQRARVGLRPRLAQDPRGAQGRRVHRHRPEGLDDVRPSLQVVHAARAHERRRAQAPRAHLLPDGHGAGRRRGPAARADHRRGRVQRAVHRRGADPGRERGRRRRQRLARGDHDAHARARRARLRAAGAGAGRAERAGGRASRDEGPDHPPALRADRDRGPGPAPARLPGPHDRDEVGRARTRGLAGQVAVGRLQSGADDAGDGRQGPVARSSWTTSGPTASCAPARTRSRAGPPRSSRTSSPSECWGCREHELRSDRGPARDQAHGARFPGRPLHDGEDPGDRPRRQARPALGRDRRARLAGCDGARHGRARRGGRGDRLRARAHAADRRPGRPKLLYPELEGRGTVAQWDGRGRREG